MSGSARPRFGDVSEDNPASPNISRKFGYDYDKSDTRIEGKWHERARSIPQSIQLMIENHEHDQQLLEIDYDTLEKAGLLNE